MYLNETLVMNYNSDNSLYYDHLVKRCYIESYENSQSIQSLSNLSPPTYNYFMKLNTPLFYTSYLGIIKDKYIDQFKKSLFFISKAQIDISNNYNYIDTRDFNSAFIRYTNQEFGNIKYSKNYSHDLKRYCFTQSSLRFLCIKAEIALFLYYHALSLLDDKNTSFEINGYIQIIIGAFKYILFQQSNFKKNKVGDIKFKAYYLWELSTFINVFADLTKHDEEHYNIPFHHVFERLYEYENEIDFGSYDESMCRCMMNDDTYGENILGGRISKLPKCETNIAFNNNTLFYTVESSNVIIECSDNFNKCIEEYMNVGNNFRLKCKILCGITRYECKYILKPKETFINCYTYYFNDTNEAKNHMSKLQINKNNNTLYVPVMNNNTINYIRYDRL